MSSNKKLSVNTVGLVNEFLKYVHSLASHIQREVVSDRPLSFDTIKVMAEKKFTAKHIESESDISELVKADKWRMGVLRAAERKALPDWWIGAGFLRNLIWDALEGNEIENSRDVDLVYFDDSTTEPEADWQYDQDMKELFPGAEWEVRNQARMHYVNNFPPYSSTADGIAHWVETATCVAVKLEEEELKYLFCYGTDDLYNLVARPTEKFRTQELLPTFYERMAKKNWQNRWPHLRVETE